MKRLLQPAEAHTRQREEIAARMRLATAAMREAAALQVAAANREVDLVELRGKDTERQRDAVRNKFKENFALTVIDTREKLEIIRSPELRRAFHMYARDTYLSIAKPDQVSFVTVVFASPSFVN
jgi:hypothetical protein